MRSFVGMIDVKTYKVALIDDRTERSIWYGGPFVYHGGRLPEIEASIMVENSVGGEPVSARVQDVRPEHEVSIVAVAIDAP